MTSDNPPAATEGDSSDTRQPCFFFKPPAEIRVRIYEFAFSPDTDDDPVKDGKDQHGKHQHGGDCSKFSCVTRETWHTRSALLQVCQLIRKGAMPIFYKDSTFHLRINKRNYIGAVDWLEEVGKEQTKLIPRLLVSWEPTEKVRRQIITLRRAEQQEAQSRRYRRMLARRSMLRAFDTRPLGRGRPPSPSSPPESTVDWRYFQQLLDLRSSESAVNRGVSEAFGREILTSGIRPDAAILEHFDPRDYHNSASSTLGDPELDELGEDFMRNLKWVIFGISKSEYEDAVDDDEG